MNTPTMLQRTIQPKEDFLFYIGALFNQQYGFVRTELVLKDHDLFFRISGIVSDLDFMLIPCGHITVKK
jgi:hypothetical protein